MEARAVLRRFAIDVVGGGCFNRELFLYFIICLKYLARYSNADLCLI
jgi:hypothetical protein